MSNIELLLHTSADNISLTDISLAEFEQRKDSLIMNVKTHGGSIKAFLGGDKLILKYPEHLLPLQNDKLLSIILDSGDRKQGFEMYESEFRLFAERWREKKWGFSATDTFGNIIARQEYDYVSGLNEMGIKMYAGNRRIYNIENELVLGKKKGIFEEMFEGIKRDIGRLFYYFKK